MSTRAHEHLRALLEATPETGQVTVPRRWIEELLNAPSGSVGDATVHELAQRYRRGHSTIRAWAEAGRFPGAYKLGRREWRFPAASIAAFDATDRPVRARATRSAAISLADWRKELPEAS